MSLEDHFKGPNFGDPVTGLGYRPYATDSRGNHYKKLPNGREKRGGRRTKGSKK